MIRVSELIDMITKEVSKDISVLNFYISIDERNDVIRFMIPLERRKDIEKEEGSEEGKPLQTLGLRRGSEDVGGPERKTDKSRPGDDREHPEENGKREG